MSKRIVVTGLGPLTSIGIGKENFWQSIVDGKSGISKIDTFDVSQYSCQIASLVKEFNPLDHLHPKLAKRTDRFVQFALVASKLAIDDSNLTVTDENRERIGVLIGSGIGGLYTMEEQHKVLMSKGPSKVSPFLVPMMICDLASGQVSIEYGLKGYNSCIVTACATGTHAIGEAAEVIRRGQADIMIAGGSESSVTELGLAGFASARALTSRNEEPEKASRPFDLNRDGFIMGEGAGIVVLEEYDSAKKRGAHIYCEIAGYGATGDAYHITLPDAEGRGASRAMEEALSNANLKPEDVDYINAHGTSTKANDSIETKAIKNTFGDHAFKMNISSTKSMTGHLLGAAGGIEAIACVLAIEKGIIPPTINYETPDPECDLDYTPNRAVSKDLNSVLSNSFGFGGHNAVLCFKSNRSI